MDINQQMIEALENLGLTNLVFDTQKHEVIAAFREYYLADTWREENYPYQSHPAIKIAWIAAGAINWVSAAG